MIPSAVLAAVLTLTQPAAPSPLSEADVDCFIVTTVAVGGLGADSDPTTLAGLVGGVGYFLGRLEGRDPQTDWLAYIETDMARVDRVVNEPATVQRCSGQMIAMGGAITAFGERIGGLSQ